MSLLPFKESGGGGVRETYMQTARRLLRKSSKCHLLSLLSSMDMAVMLVWLKVPTIFMSYNHFS